MIITAGSLHSYLQATSETATDHKASPPQLMPLVEGMDDFFQQEIFGRDFNAHQTAGLLVAHAYTMLLSAVREALAGHAVCTYPIARTALESACYAFLIAQDPAKSDVWFDRNESTDSLEKCRKVFTANNATRALRHISPDMANMVKELYDASIDFGAHPNRRSIVNHLSNGGPTEDNLHRFDLTGVYGHNSWEVNHSLLACVEFGHAVAFLSVACAEDHPLLNEHVERFQGWMDEKNKLLEEINGGPLEYSGPLYLSLAKP